MKANGHLPRNASADDAQEGWRTGELSRDEGLLSNGLLFVLGEFAAGQHGRGGDTAFTPDQTTPSWEDNPLFSEQWLQYRNALSIDLGVVHAWEHYYWKHHNGAAVHIRSWGSGFKDYNSELIRNDDPSRHVSYGGGILLGAPSAREYAYLSRAAADNELARFDMTSQPVTAWYGKVQKSSADDAQEARRAGVLSRDEAHLSDGRMSVDLEAFATEQHGPGNDTAFAPDQTTPSWEDDPLFSQQWYLQNRDETGIDLNVVKAWKDYDGAGVHIGIWDWGFEYDHPDLIGNYDPSRHVVSDDGTITDPAPESVYASHGTAVAGVIAAADNDIGIVGVAHGSRITGFDYYDDAWTEATQDLQTDELLRFDVTNHSYNSVTPWYSNILDGTFAYDGDTQNWNGEYFSGFLESVILGRDGLGTINVVASGNFRQRGRTTNDSSITAIPETIAVAAVNHRGDVAVYSTPGANILVSGLSSSRWFLEDGKYKPFDPAILTTDLQGDPGYNWDMGGMTRDQYLGIGDYGMEYGGTFGGTSAAAPMVAGVAALMLQANPDLGWRDVQDILASTARHVGSAIGEGPSGAELYTWSFNGGEHWNGGGLHFSNDYGFGLIDALAAVRVAESWTKQQTSMNWRHELGDSWSSSLHIPDASTESDGVTVVFEVNSQIDLATVAVTLEFSDINPNIYDQDESYTSDYDITLLSPDGTTSVLSRASGWGTSLNGKVYLTSEAFRGENPDGQWTLEIVDRVDGTAGTLEGAEINLLGDDPSPDDTYIFTNEFGDYAGRWGHSTVLHDSDGGIDTINAAAVSSNTTLDFVDGTGTIDGTAVSGFAGIENAFTGDGNDWIIAGNGQNHLSGNRGNDVLSGGKGNDILEGGPDGDVIYGGHGNDTISDGDGTDALTGGVGSDRFILALDGDIDKIYDFQRRIDTLEFIGVPSDNLFFAQDGDALRINVDLDDDPGTIDDTLLVYGESHRQLDMIALGPDDIFV